MNSTSKDSSMFASASSGEMFFTHRLSSASEFLPYGLPPFKYLYGSMVSLLKGIKDVFKDKKKLKLSIVLATIWTVLILLRMFKIEGSWVSYMNFFTFAQGGMHSGVPGIVGGTIGKVVFSYFLFTFITPLFSGRKPLSGFGPGFRVLFSSFSIKGSRLFIPQLLGLGMALIAYNFLTGNASLQNSMVGIAAFVISLKALSQKQGFLRGFLMSLSGKFKKNKFYDPKPINRFIAGWASGFALAVILSSSNYVYICYASGVASIVVAVILMITLKPETPMELQNEK
jgi:hypothetical protein